MRNNTKQVLRFSEPFVIVELVSSPRDYAVETRTIVVNASEQAFPVEGKPLMGWSSAILSHVRLTSVDPLICIVLNGSPELGQSFPYAREIESKWKHVFDIFALPHLRNTPLWRSEKERIGNNEYNLWFARSGTNCGIHNEHGFREVHTQVFGHGRMQKFREPNVNSLYQDVYMCPGFTHEPFCDKNDVYPWHQYYADTDCIWLAIETCK